MRRHIGVGLLAASVAHNAAELFGLVRPYLLRMRAHGGYERTLALILGSVSLKAVMLAAAVLLAFWPERSPASPRPSR